MEQSDNGKHEVNRVEEAMNYASSQAIDADDPLNWPQKKVRQILPNVDLAQTLTTA